MIAFPAGLIARAEMFIERARGVNATVAAAESCTGGLVAALLTEIAGSSAVVERGFVTYSNEAKIELLDVSAALIERRGAVSEAVARAMAEGALARSSARLAVAVTGVAGPGGGSAEKPVGLVHLACAIRGRETTAVERRFGSIGRAAVRAASVSVALDLLSDALDQDTARRP